MARASFVWQAILPAGGLSGRRFRYATNFSGFAVSMREDAKPEKYLPQVELRSTGQAKACPTRNADMSVGAADTSVRATSGAMVIEANGQRQTCRAQPRSELRSRRQPEACPTESKCRNEYRRRLAQSLCPNTRIGRDIQATLIISPSSTAKYVSFRSCITD
jgi:hypothetical protein